jgi:hypothetical protein
MLNQGKHSESALERIRVGRLDHSCFAEGKLKKKNDKVLQDKI